MIPLPRLGSSAVGSKAVTLLVELCWKRFTKPTPRGILSVSTYTRMKTRINPTFIIGLDNQRKNYIEEMIKHCKPSLLSCCKGNKLKLHISLLYRFVSWAEDFVAGEAASRGMRRRPSSPPSTGCGRRSAGRWNRRRRRR